MSGDSNPRAPYVAGAVLGVTAAVSDALASHPLGASGAFERTIGVLGVRLWPANTYWTFVAIPSFGWENLVLVGVAIGAFASALARRSVRIRTMPETGWTESFGPSRATRWIIAFIGAALVEFAAGIAGGCTSGLGVSGGILFAPAAYVFMAGMFAGGIPTAAWIAWMGRHRQSHAEGVSTAASGAA